MKRKETDLYDIQGNITKPKRNADVVTTQITQERLKKPSRPTRNEIIIICLIYYRDRDESIGYTMIMIKSTALILYVLFYSTRINHAPHEFVIQNADCYFIRQ